MNYPYSDNYMIFDEQTGRYILTENYVREQLGIDLSEAINERNTTNQQIAVKRVLRQVSNAVYNFIHQYNVSTDLQDFIIKKVPSARVMIQEAMAEQFLYMSAKGDLSRSTDKEKRALAMDENAKAVLERVLPELGICILYTGNLWRFSVCQF